MPSVPASTPKQARAQSATLLATHGVTDEFGLIGLRGYYLDTMGMTGQNDRGIYDDAIVLVTPTAYVTFNANADPAQFKPGIANLKCGVWSYRLGTHNLSKSEDRQYEALVQAAPVTVTRDEAGEETGWFGINIHKGGYNTTSSLGCQTIYPTQWQGFIALVKQEMKRHGRTKVPYVLVEHAGG